MGFVPGQPAQVQQAAGLGVELIVAHADVNRYAVMSRAGESAPIDPDGFDEMDDADAPLGRLIMVGGGFGALARYGLSLVLPTAGNWPLPTLLTNLAGALLLGMLMEGLSRCGPAVSRVVLLGGKPGGRSPVGAGRNLVWRQIPHHHQHHHQHRQGRVAMTVILLVVASRVGAGLRFLVDGLVRARVCTALPLGTIMINVAGPLLLGLLSGLVSGHSASAAVGLILGTGSWYRFLGGFTTFSTASVETVRLVQGGRTGLPIVNALGTPMRIRWP